MGPLPLPSSGNTELRWFPPRADKRLNYRVSFFHVLAYAGRVLEQFVFKPVSMYRLVHRNHSYLVRRVLYILFINEFITSVLVIRCIFYVCAFLIAFSLHLATVRLIDSMFVFLTLIRWTFILSRQYVGCSICLYNLVATIVCLFAKKYTVYE